MKNKAAMTNDEIKILTAKELADILRIGRDKAYALIKSSSFPSICIGKRYVVTEKALYEWLSRYEHRTYML